MIKPANPGPRLVNDIFHPSLRCIPPSITTHHSQFPFELSNQTPSPGSTMHMVRTAIKLPRAEPSSSTPFPCHNYFSILNTLEAEATNINGMPGGRPLEMKNHDHEPSPRSPCRHSRWANSSPHYSHTANDSSSDDSELDMVFRKPSGSRGRRPIFDDNHIPCLDPREQYEEVFTTVREISRLTDAFHRKVETWKLRPPGSPSHYILRVQIDRLVPHVIHMTQKTVLDAACLKLSSYERKPRHLPNLYGYNHPIYSRLSFRGLQKDTLYVSYRYQKEFGLRGDWVDSEEEKEVDGKDFGAQANPYRSADSHINWVVTNLDEVGHMMPDWE